MNFKVLAFVIFCAVVAVAIWGWDRVIQTMPASPMAPAVPAKPDQQKIPDFSLPDIHGKSRSIREWDGKIIILNFWATWCPPCLRETPLFVELQETYGKQGVQFIGVAIDELQEVRDFIDTYGVNYPILIGAEDAVKISIQYGNRTGVLPFTLIIDRNGRVVLEQMGELTRDVAEQTINKLLKD